MPPRRRSKGLAVKPELIRLARQEANLSLEQLASGEVSRQAIHQYETGLVRPTFAVLRLIADRTGKPLDYFLEDPPPDPAQLLAELERFWLGREYASAFEVGERILASPGVDPDTEAKTRLWVGASLVGLSKPVEALPHLRRSRELFAGKRNELGLCEAMDWESCALHLSEAPGDIRLGEEALLKCRSIVPTPALVLARILSHLGSFYVRHRQWPQAKAAYEEGLAAAGEIADLRQLALMHHNLSIAYQRMGRPDEALREAERALAMFGAQSNQAEVARMHGDFGDLLRAQGDLEGAERELREALRIFEMTTDRRNRGYSLLTLAEVRCEQARFDEASSILDEVAAKAEANAENLLLSCVWRIRGRIAGRQERWREAEKWFDQSATMVQRLGHPERESEVHSEWADLLELQGDLRGALEHMRLANAGITRGQGIEPRDAAQAQSETA